MLRSILLSCGTALLALLYILAPLHQFVLEAAHDLEHEFDHITQSEHQHDFFTAEELLAEAGHDHLCSGGRGRCHAIQLSKRSLR